MSYTSAIILKRAVKAKLDIGILLMSCIYTPVIYNLVQSVTSESASTLAGFLLLPNLITISLSMSFYVNLIFTQPFQI